MKINTFIFMGRPGAGKGVQSALLAESLGVHIFSTGGRVREISKEDSALGRKVKAVQEAGELTPFWFAAFLFEEAFFKLRDEDGIIFEGLGRKEPEAKLFTEASAWLGRDFRVINLEVSEESVTKRLEKRRELEYRIDDEPEKIRVRLDLYARETAPALEYFRSVGKVIDVDGEPLPDAVHAEVLEKIAPFIE